MDDFLCGYQIDDYHWLKPEVNLDDEDDDSAAECDSDDVDCYCDD